MTYPDSGAPADPRDELAAIRRRLAEITPAGPRGAGNGLLVAGSLALAAALVALIVAVAVASTLDGPGQAAVLIVGVCALLGFAVLGFAVLRRWQARSSSVGRATTSATVSPKILTAVATSDAEENTMKLYVCWGTFKNPLRPGGHPCGNAYHALKDAGHDPEVLDPCE